MNYDEKCYCYEVAGYFLSDESELNSTARKERLAQAIQDAIESTIAGWKAEAKKTGAQSHEQQRG